MDRTLEGLKGEFKSVFREAKASAPTQVVLCRGPIGGGKAHASLFFSYDKNIPETSPSVQNIEVLRVQTPTETGNPARDFYQDVIEQIGLDRIGDAVKKNVQSVGRDVVEQNLRQTMVSRDFANALLKLFEASPILPRHSPEAQGVETPWNHDGSAGGERGKGGGDYTVNVEQGHDAQGDVVRREAVGLDYVAHRRHQVLVGKRDALGPAGGAAGVQDEGRIRRPRRAVAAC